MVTDRFRTQARARATLDERFEAWRQLPAKGARPHGGWVRAIREALGMRAEDLANRMGVSQPTLTRLESNERRGSVRLDTLQRAADALECDVVYALVPRRSLGEMVNEQARTRALERMGRVAHTMALEDQALNNEQLEKRVRDLASMYLTMPGLWSVHADAHSTSAERTRAGTGA
ncbi:mobile mystery protein A [Aeromicrobium sp. Root236]|uniref:mobile mystery protein A n=1 Tax=Aeromicrobium sp. Root236 TaxID=1736498 RepID=UPI00190FDFD1